MTLKDRREPTKVALHARNVQFDWSSRWLRPEQRSTAAARRR